MTLVFDIETGPVADDELRSMLPEFVTPAHPGEFEPASVKTGNLKDKAKIDEKVQAARDEHERRLASYAEDVEIGRKNHWLAFKAQAALSPLTGRVLAIGMLQQDKPPDLIFGDETEMLWQFWAQFTTYDELLAGWNIHNFDLPFLIRRSWKLGVDVPSGVRDRTDRYWDARWIDLMVRFMAGNRMEKWVRLDDAAKFFGVGEKNGSGAEFAAMWEVDREGALAYLRNDLELTLGVARKMGVC